MNIYIYFPCWQFCPTFLYLQQCYSELLGIQIFVHMCKHFLGSIPARGAAASKDLSILNFDFIISPSKNAILMDTTTCSVCKCLFHTPLWTLGIIHQLAFFQSDGQYIYIYIFFFWLCCSLPWLFGTLRHLFICLLAFAYLWSIFKLNDFFFHYMLWIVSLCSLLLVMWLCLQCLTSREEFLFLCSPTCHDSEFWVPLTEVFPSQIFKNKIVLYFILAGLLFF